MFNRHLGFKLNLWPLSHLSNHSSVEQHDLKMQAKEQHILDTNAGKQQF
jgi:hypothetical protein